MNIGIIDTTKELFDSCEQIESYLEDHFKENGIEKRTKDDLLNLLNLIDLDIQQIWDDHRESSIFKNYKEIFETSLSLFIATKIRSKIEKELKKRYGLV